MTTAQTPTLSGSECLKLSAAHKRKAEGYRLMSEEEVNAAQDEAKEMASIYEMKPMAFFMPSDPNPQGLSREELTEMDESNQWYEYWIRVRQMKTAQITNTVGRMEVYRDYLTSAYEAPNALNRNAAQAPSVKKADRKLAILRGEITDREGQP